MPNFERKIRVLVVDDQAVIREGQSLLLSEHEELEIVGTASNGQDAVDIAQSLDPDVVIMDIQVATMDGMDAINRIRRTSPTTRFIAMSGHLSADEAQRAARMGAHAYVLKDGPSEELVQAIRDVHSGRSDLNRGS